MFRILFKLSIVVLFLFHNSELKSFTNAQAIESEEEWVMGYENNSNAVTIILSKKRNKPFSYGTGFNVDSEGLVITNYHVVDGSDEVIVRFKNGDEFIVKHYSYVDKEKDFVILKIAGYDLPIISLGNSNDVKIGSKVAAIGNPKGALGTITDGIISQVVNFQSHQMFQTNVFIAPGSSGGPLFNRKNEVIGVTTSGIKEGLDINYAIPINYVIGGIKAMNSQTIQAVEKIIIVNKTSSNNKNKISSNNENKISSNNESKISSNKIDSNQVKNNQKSKPYWQRAEAEIYCYCIWLIMVLIGHL